MPKNDTLLWLLVASCFLVACGGNAQQGAQPPAPVAIQLATSQMAFDPAQLTVQAGQPVRLTLTNSDALDHDFTIQAIPLAGEANASGGEHAHDASAEAADLHVAAAAGGEGTLDFTPETPGEYQFYCSVPGHKEAGMTGQLVVAP